MAKRIALVAHDARKEIIVDWARDNATRLAGFSICATGTTGGRLQAEAGLEVERLLSGPLGGDAQPVGEALVHEVGDDEGHHPPRHHLAHVLQRRE